MADDDAASVGEVIAGRGKPVKEVPVGAVVDNVVPACSDGVRPRTHLVRRPRTLVGSVVAQALAKLLPVLLVTRM